MKGPLTNEAVTTSESAKTQIAEQFLTGVSQPRLGLVEVHHAPWNLADRYRVVAPGLPGFGFTEVSEKRHYKYSLEWGR
jgi:hypothetical protein